jgi:glutamate dehydrogenase
MSADQISTFKVKQALHVASLITAQGMINSRQTPREVDWFYNHLGIDAYYFLSTPPASIADHIQSIYAGKILAITSRRDQDFELRTETDDSAMFALRSNPPANLDQTMWMEESIEERYLQEGRQSSPVNINAMWRVHGYRSSGTVSPTIPVHLRFYFLQRPCFPVHDSLLSSNNQLQSISDVSFYKRTSLKTHALYWSMIQEAVVQLHAVVRLVETRILGELRIVIAYAHGSTHNLFSSLTPLFYSNGLYATKVLNCFTRGFTFVVNNCHVEFISEICRVVCQWSQDHFLLPACIACIRHA